MSWRQNSNLLAVAGRFSVVGFINTGLGFLTIFGLMAAGVEPFVSNAVGFGAGLCISFLLHRGWVFNQSGRSAIQVSKYVISVLAAYAINISTLSALLKMDCWPYLAQVLAAGSYTVTLFLLSAQWVFRGDGKTR